MYILENDTSKTNRVKLRVMTRNNRIAYTPFTEVKDRSKIYCIHTEVCSFLNLHVAIKLLKRKVNV